MLKSKNLLTILLVYSLIGLIQSCGKGNDASRLLSGGGGSSSGSTKASESSGNTGGSSASPAPTYFTIGASQFSTVWIDGTSKGAAGSNEMGQLGTGQATGPGSFSNGPTAISDVTGMGSLKAVFGGTTHVCVLDIDNELFCSGFNIFGQLGVGNTTNPYNTFQLVDSGNTYKQAAAGYFHTCGIRSNGDLYCWGSEMDGRLGTGVALPAFGNQPSPVQVDAGVKYSKVAVGWFHSCAITVLGTIKCWGKNNYGQLGLGSGDTTSRSSPVDIVAPVGATFMAISASVNHTCAIRSDEGNIGKVMCWGRNDQGQLGDGNSDDDVNEDLVFVDNDTDPDNNIFSQICSGGAHTCGMEATVVDGLLVNTGKIKCWGEAQIGQIGNGSFAGTNGTEQLVAAYVNTVDEGSGVEDYTTVVCGENHTCASTANEYYCWGENEYAQLGNSGLTNSTGDSSSFYNTPQLVDPLP